MRAAGTHLRWLREHRRFRLGRRTVRAARPHSLSAGRLAWDTSSVPGPPAAPTRPCVGSVANATSLSGAGYVAVSGNYAYTAAYYAGTITVVDISNPAAPQVVGQSPSSNAILSASHLTIVGSNLYVVSQNRNGASGTGSNDDGTGNSLAILDISDPTAPTIVGTLHNSSVMFGPHGVAVSGNYAYIAAQGCLNQQPCPNPSVGDSLVVVDISNPSNPTIAASIQNSNLPAPWTGTGALKHACGITISGNYAYVTASYSHRLTIVDISDPLHPSIVGIDPRRHTPPGPGRRRRQERVRIRRQPDARQRERGGGRRSRPHRSSGRRIPPQLAAERRLPDPGPGQLRLRRRHLRERHRRARYLGSHESPARRELRQYAAPEPHGRGRPRPDGAVRDLDIAVALDRLLGRPRPLYPPFPLQPGGPSATGTVSAIALDPTPIGVSDRVGAWRAPHRRQRPCSRSRRAMRSRPSAAPSTVAFRSARASTPTSQSYSSLAPGPHTFTVKAIDAADRSATATLQLDRHGVDS